LGRFPAFFAGVPMAEETKRRLYCLHAKTIRKLEILAVVLKLDQAEILKRLIDEAYAATAHEPVPVSFDTIMSLTND
jgi:hypothetical protein